MCLLPESYTIKSLNKTITVTGGDERGLIYGCLSLAEDIRNGVSLAHYPSKTEKPFLPFRAIKYDLPWDTSQLEKDCHQALAIVNHINPNTNKALLYEVADIKTWAYLGLHFAEKIKGGIALQRYRTLVDEKNKSTAILHLQKALTYWDSIISITRPLYNEMPLVHYSQQGGKESKENNYLTFHWSTLRAAVANDIDIAKEASVN